MPRFKMMAQRKSKKEEVFKEADNRKEQGIPKKKEEASMKANNRKKLGIIERKEEASKKPNNRKEPGIIEKEESVSKRYRSSKKANNRKEEGITVKDESVSKRSNTNRNVESMEEDTMKECIAKSGFLTSCKPNGLCSLVKELNDAQKAAVIEIGFGSLLSLSIYRCHTGILKWVCDSFNGTSRIFHIDNNRSFPITLEDVYDVLCLPLSNTPVEEYTRSESFELVTYFKENFDLSGDSCLNTLRNLVKSLHDGGDDFKRLFVFYALSSFLTPSANRSLRMSVCKSLVDVSAIPKLNWSGYLYNHLCSSANSYNSSKKSDSKKLKITFSGCCVLLQILYYHRLKWQGVSEPCTIPLLQHWPQEKFINRAVQESKVGFGDCVLVEGLYPITKEHTQKGKRLASDPPSRGVGGEKRRRVLQFELADDDLSDSDIKKLSKDGVEERILQFRRNLSVVISHSLNLILEAKRQEGKKQEDSEGEKMSCSQTESRKLFEDIDVRKIIDEAIKEAYCKFAWDRSGSSFNICTPIPETQKEDPTKTASETPKVPTPIPSPETLKETPIKAFSELVLSCEVPIPFPSHETSEEEHDVELDQIED